MQKEEADKLLSKSYAFNNATVAEIYTDGSCHTQQKIGAWVAILLIGQEKKLLTGTELNTTHNRMELTAVIKSIEHVRANHPGIKIIKIYSDSQYVIDLTARKEKITAHGFYTRQGNELQNVNLVKALLKHAEFFIIEFVKIKAHQKKSDAVNHNIEADKLSRKMVRKAVKEKSE